MPRLETERHERFVREYIKLGCVNAAEAYRRTLKAFGRPIGHPVSPAVSGSNWARRPDVKARIMELRQQMAKRADITIDKILSDYQRALDLANKQEKPGEIVNAATAQAKLVGLLKDRVETGAPGEFDTLDNISDILEKVSQEAGPEAALALSKAMGVSTTEITIEPAQVEQPEQDQMGEIPVLTRTVN